MNIKTYISILALSIVPFAAGAKELSAKDTITDNNIIYPSSLDTDVKTLQDNWYLQRYAVLDNTAKKKTNAKVSDAVYVDRLQALPNIIEMPYNSIVKKYIEMYSRREGLVEKMLGMSLYYMPIFEEALERYQLPNELKYLPIIESALNPNAVSKAGACGLWQLMPTTATGEGLEVNSLVDQRRDPYASSEAAAHLLSTLHEMFGDWTLAIAAYNCGPGTVNKAMKRANGTKDFWVLYPYLPQETRGYVPAFIAANYIMNYYAEHGINHALARKPIVTDTVHVKNKVHLKQISEVLGLPIDEVRILNPQYRQDIIPGNIRPYTLTLPSMQAFCYVENEDSVLNYKPDAFFGREVAEPYTGTSASPTVAGYQEQLVSVQHTVEKGETLKSIAKKYGVTAESIRRTNHISKDKVKTGTVLNIQTYEKQKVAVNDNALAQNGATPGTMASGNTTAQGYSYSAPKASTTPTQNYNQKRQQNTKQATQKKNTKYTVKSGDSLSKIAARNGMTVAQLKKLNGLKNDNIKPGQTLTVSGKATTATASKAKASKTTAKSKSKAKRTTKKRR